MASLLSITQEGPIVYLNEQLEAAFEILQSDGSTFSLRLLAAVRQLQRTMTFFINLHVQFSTLSSHSLSAQPGEDCIFSFLFCIIDDWKLYVEFCLTSSWWNPAQFALSVSLWCCPHMQLQRSLHLAADRTACDNNQRTTRSPKKRQRKSGNQSKRGEPIMLD